MGSFGSRELPFLPAALTPRSLPPGCSQDLPIPVRNLVGRQALSLKFSSDVREATLPTLRSFVVARNTP